MPKKAHEALRKAARKKGLKGERAKRYVYGTLQKIEKAQKTKRKIRKKK